MGLEWVCFRMYIAGIERHNTSSAQQLNASTYKEQLRAFLTEVAPREPE